MNSEPDETVWEFADDFANDGYDVDVYGGDDPTAVVYLKPETPYEAIVGAAKEAGLHGEFDRDEGAVLITES